MRDFILYGGYSLCVLFHRFYMRYILYSIYLFISANGQILTEFNKNAKNKGYKGHNLRVVQWEHFKKSEDSQFGYLLSTTFNPLFMGFIYFIILDYFIN